MAPLILAPDVVMPGVVAHVVVLPGVVAHVVVLPGEVFVCVYPFSREGGTNLFGDHRGSILSNRADIS